MHVLPRILVKDFWSKFWLDSPQILAELEAEREAKELYQSKLEESLRSDDTDDDISEIPTKIIGSPHRVTFFLGYSSNVLRVHNIL